MQMVENYNTHDLKRYLSLQQQKSQRQYRASPFAVGLGLGIPYAGNNGSAFNGNFTSVLTGGFQLVQGNRGLTYGGTMAPNAANTSTATMPLTGSLATSPVPIWIKLTGTGNTGNVYYDGLGTTPSMTGVTVAAGTPIVLTGAASGLMITPTAGTLVLNDFWKATWAAWADQTVNAKHYSATASIQPVVGIGFGGMCSAIFDGVDDRMTSALALAAPATVNVDRYVIWRWITNGAAAAGVFCANEGFKFLLDNAASAGAVRMYDGVTLQTTMPTGTWYRTVEHYVGTSSSSFRVGSTTLTGDVGNDFCTSMNMGCRVAGTNPGNIEVLIASHHPPQSYAAADAAVAAMAAASGVTVQF